MFNKKPETTLAEDLKHLGLLAEEAKVEDEGADKEMKAEKKEEKKDEKAKDHKEPDGDECDDAKKMEAAWDVVKAYCSVAESNDKLDEAELRTVIDATLYIIEGLMNSGEPTKDPKDLPAGGEHKLFAPGMDPVADSALKSSPLAPEKAKKGYGRFEPKDKAPTDLQRKELVKTEGLKDLVSELKAIQKTVAEAAPADDETKAQLSEGFDSIAATAAEVASRIQGALAEAKNVAEDDVRVVAKNFFESIAKDAQELLTGLAEGKVEFATAAEDLETLAGDLKKGFAGLEALENK